jgi:RNA polymerase sigma-54 factor
MGARDLRECLLLQIDARQRQSLQHYGNGRAQGNGHGNGDAHAQLPVDLSIERAIVSEYLKDVEVNRLPKIAKSLGVDVERIKQAILNLRQFHPHPGRLLVDERPRVITPDAIVEFDEDRDCYMVRLFSGRLPSVHISPQYLKLAHDSRLDRKTREFIGNNIRSSRWLLDAIQQRQHTLLRVINVVLEAQRDFFDSGPQALKPLPMTQIADQLGIHVATVSRAVNGKYIQCPRGIFPLRMFFSGGAETTSGDAMSWAAMKAKVQEIVDQEDKANPLSDDELVIKLKEKGIEIARRTIAKYRSELKIPTARQRKIY